ncbi:hypothetical protein D3C84_458000 [compost metagenome]
MVFHCIEVAGSTAAPPPMARRRREKSTSPMRGWRTRVPYRVLTPVSRVGLAMIIVSSRSSLLRASGISQFSAPAEKQVSRFTISANTWKSGSAVTTTLSPSLSNMSGRNARACRMLATRLRWDSAAPFDGPVVPPVYCRKTRSSPFRSTGASCSVPPSRRASAKRVIGKPCDGRMPISATAADSPRVSPGCTAMIVLTVVRSRTSSSVGKAPANMTMVSTPASLSWCSSSCGVYVGLTLTWTAPARRTPNIATGNAGMLGSMTATRSPRAMPRCCR